MKLRLLMGLLNLFGRRNPRRQSKKRDQATTTDEEKVTRVMAKKIIDDARIHRLSVDQEAEGQKES